MQVMDRACRFNDFCKRLQVQGLIPVNATTNLADFNTLMTYWREIEYANVEQANSKIAAKQAARI